MLNECYIGDCRDGLRAFVASGHKAQVCVTSPPYWGLRDYGHDDAFGLEPTFDEWLSNMVDTFESVWDALSDDGTLWLNMGDSYATGTKAARQAGNRGISPRTQIAQDDVGRPGTPLGLKTKDIMGQPWRLAFALQEAGWYLRQDIIWHKPSPMPESVRDRCTKSHEYMFLLTKQPRYYFNAEAISEEASPDTHARKAVAGWATGPGSHDTKAHAKSKKDVGRDDQGLRDSTKFGRGPGWRNKQNESFAADVTEVLPRRNKRSVWKIPSAPYSGAHFATFPPALVEPCVLAGSRTGDIVLDPFMGSGTTAMVAEKLGRRWFGCEINPDNLALQRDRLRQQSLGL